ncbi:hypothetical protein JCM6882_000104 [Rhodosporidiobolus microsporus]
MTSKGHWRSDTGPLPPERDLSRAPPARRNRSDRSIVDIFEERKARGFGGGPSARAPGPSYVSPAPAPSAQRAQPAFHPRPPPPAPPPKTPLALPPSHQTLDPLAPFLASDLNVLGGPRVRLREDWPGFRVEALLLGTLDERAFGAFRVERDCKIEQGRLRVGEEKGPRREEGKGKGAGKGTGREKAQGEQEEDETKKKAKEREVSISGYAFNGGAPVKIKFPPGSIMRVYAAPMEEEEEVGSGAVVSECERVKVVIETECTPHFHGYYSNLPSGNPSGSVRLTAFDRKHLDVVPFLSRHFLLILSVPRDTSLAGEPPTPYSLRDLSHRLSSVSHLPNLVHLPSLPLLPHSRQYSSASLKRLSKTFASVSPAIAYHLEGILRDGTLSPAELVALVTDHVVPWTVTPSVPYGEANTEDIMIELRGLLERDREARALALKIGARPEEFRTERDWRWTLEDKCGEAHDAVVEGRARAERERKEKLQAGLKAKVRKDEAMRREHFQCRTIVFTPSRTVLAIGRTDELSNALIRKYYHPIEYHSESDYFLRVQFAEEDGLTLPGGSGAPWARLVDGSMKAMMLKGLRFGGRTYKFLAYSQSSLRERSVWFVAPWPVETDGERRMIKAADIRLDLGDFEKVQRQPAMLGARYSQAFTSSRASIFLRDDQILELEDILVLDDDGNELSNHTDGAGVMSLELRNEVWKTLLKNGFRRDKDAPPPTVFQFRLGGYKGVLALDTTLSGVQLALRPSQRKFEGFQDDPATASFSLCIADAFTRPNCLRLNRPLISALNDLGIDTGVFIAYRRRAIDELAPTDLQTLFGAHAVLNKYTFGGATRFRQLLWLLFELRCVPDALLQEEPFLRLAFDVIRARTLRDLKNSARIPVEGAYSLVGVPDEDSFLQPHQIYACLRWPDKPDHPLYLEGTVAITRSPVVDPGDVRIVQAVGKLPEGVRLRMAALENCVVLPTTGGRSLASMMGGGDVDGDKFDLIPRPDLIPHQTVPPRSHKADPPLTLDRAATIDDVASCFINYVCNDALGVIATQHLIAADQEPLHGLSTKCKKLADLYSRAVDTPKTGVIIDREKLPKKAAMRPDFLCFSDGDLPQDTERSYYRSERALGYLYRDIDENELKTPSALGEEPPLDSSAIDSSSRSFGVLRLVVENKLANFFDCTPADLGRLVDDRRRVLTDKLTSFCSSLSDLATTYSLPRTSGRKLAEEEIFAVTSLLEAEKNFQRGNLVVGLARQVTNLVEWLEKELTGPEVLDAASSAVEVETLARRYAAWMVAREMSELEFGVKTARWTGLALLLDALDKVEKEKAEAGGASSPTTRVSVGDTLPGARPPPAVTPAAFAYDPHTLLTPPASPSNARSMPSFETAPSAPRPRIPLETRPTTTPFSPLPQPPRPMQQPLPPQLPLPSLPHPHRPISLPPAQQQPAPFHPPVLSALSPADPWFVRERREEQYGPGVTDFNDPGEDYPSDEDEDDEEEDELERFLAPLKRGAVGAASIVGAPPVGTVGSDEDDEDEDEDEDEILWTGRVAEQLRREEEEEAGRAEQVRREVEAEEQRAREQLARGRERRAYVAGRGQWGRSSGEEGGGGAEKVEGEGRGGRDEGYGAASTSAYLPFASTSNTARLPPPQHLSAAPPPPSASHLPKRDFPPAYPSSSFHPPAPPDAFELQHPTPRRHGSLPPPPVLDHPLAAEQQQQHYRLDTPGHGGWEEEPLPSTRRIPEAPSGNEEGEQQQQSPPPQQDGRGVSSSSPVVARPKHPPAPPMKRRKYPGNQFWTNFNDRDQRRYASNKTGLGKLGRYMVTADGVSYREAYGLGRAPTPEWKKERREREGGGVGYGGEGEWEGEQDAVEGGGGTGEGWGEGGGGQGGSWTTAANGPSSPTEQLDRPPHLAPSSSACRSLAPPVTAQEGDDDDARNRPWSPSLPSLPPRSPRPRFSPSLHPHPSSHTVNYDHQSNAAPAIPAWATATTTYAAVAAPKPKAKHGGSRGGGGQWGAPGDGGGKW